MPAERPDLVRLSVNMNQETAAALKGFANARGLTYTEAVRRLISIGTYVSNEIAEGNDIRIVEDGSSVYRKLILL